MRVLIIPKEYRDKAIIWLIEKGYNSDVDLKWMWQDCIDKFENIYLNIDEKYITYESLSYFESKNSEFLKIEKFFFEKFRKNKLNKLL